MSLFHITLPNAPNRPNSLPLSINLKSAFSTMLERLMFCWQSSFSLENQ